MIVGINLLREGLDLPEVSLVAIIDADKEGYLRSSTSLIQTIGRAARHANGKVIMYADKITGSMQYAITETNRRRELQGKYNKDNNIIPQTIKKDIRDITERIKSSSEKISDIDILSDDIAKEDLSRMIKDLESQMKTSSKNLEFEKDALLRDQIIELRKILIN